MQCRPVSEIILSTCIRALCGRSSPPSQHASHRSEGLACIAEWSNPAQQQTGPSEIRHRSLHPAQKTVESCGCWHLWEDLGQTRVCRVAASVARRIWRGGSGGIGTAFSFPSEVWWRCEATLDIPGGLRATMPYASPLLRGLWQMWYVRLANATHINAGQIRVPWGSTSYSF